MAVIKVSPPVGAISGDVGGLNFCWSRFGDVVRTRRVWTDRETAGQLMSRGLVGRCAAAWRALTDGERQAYEATGRAIGKADRFGVKRPMKGYTLFSEIFMCFWPDWPFTGDGDIPITISPPASLYVEDWEWDGDLPVRINEYKGGFHWVTVYASRPMSGRRVNCKRNWRRVFHEEIVGGWIDLGAPGSRADLLEGLIPGEVIGLKCRVAEYAATGYQLFSEPVETTVLVVA